MDSFLVLDTGIDPSNFRGSICILYIDIFFPDVASPLLQVVHWGYHTVIGSNQFICKVNKEKYTQV